MRYIIHLSLHCHHHNNSCINMASDESRFYVSLIVRDKVTRQCPRTTTFEEEGEPKRNTAEVLLLSNKVSRFQGFIELLAPGGRFTARPDRLIRETDSHSQNG